MGSSVPGIPGDPLLLTEDAVAGHGGRTDEVFREGNHSEGHFRPGREERHVGQVLPQEY